MADARRASGDCGAQRTSRLSSGRHEPQLVPHFSVRLQLRELRVRRAGAAREGVADLRLR